MDSAPAWRRLPDARFSPAAVRAAARSFRPEDGPVSVVTMLLTGDTEQRSANEGLATLKKRADFLQVQKGRKSVRNSLILQVRDRRDGSSLVRTGFTVSRKVGNAVERNRVRRRLRAALGETAPVAARDGHDYVVVGRRMTLQTPYRTIVDDLASAFRSIHRAPASDR